MMINELTYTFGFHYGLTTKIIFDWSKFGVGGGAPEGKCDFRPAIYSFDSLKIDELY